MIYYFNEIGRCIGAKHSKNSVEIVETEVCTPRGGDSEEAWDEKKFKLKPKYLCKLNLNFRFLRDLKFKMEGVSRINPRLAFRFVGINVKLTTN